MENSQIPVMDAGPIEGWWITGYLQDEEIKVS